MRLQTIIRVERNAKRFVEILGIIQKYGLASWLSNVKFEWLHQHLRAYTGEIIGEKSVEERVRLALTDLGSTFVKLGQMLSTRPDLVGPDMAAELEKLQSDVPADPSGVVRESLANELGTPVESLFAEFDDKELASASIGQVHAAVLHDGRNVVVKVQHAGVEEKLTRDLEILVGLAELAENYAPGIQAYQPVATAQQLRRVLLRELDYTAEKRNLETFARNFANNEFVHVPSVVPDLCSRRVLTMERLTGTSLENLNRLRDSGTDLGEIARHGANMFLDMIFRDGFYHADPHAGNLMVLPGGAIGILDCGMVGRIDEKLREDIEGMLLAAVDQNVGQLTDYIVRLGSVPSGVNLDELRQEIGDFMASYMNQSLQEFDLGGALNGMIDIIRRYRIILPSSFSLLLKVLVMLEGTFRRLNPDFNLAELLHPYYVKTVRRRMSPIRLWHKVYHTLLDWERLVEAMPRDVLDIMGRVRQGSFDVNLEHRRLDFVVNRLVLGILTAALFLGSAIMWAANTPPLIGGVSLFGMFGCLTAFFMGFRLVLAIRGSGDLTKKE